MCALALVALGADARLTENTHLEKFLQLNITCAPSRAAQTVDVSGDIADDYDQCASEFVQYLFNYLGHCGSTTECMKREGYQPTQYPNGAVCNSSVAGCTPGVGTDAETGQAAVALMTAAAGVAVGPLIANSYVANQALVLTTRLGEIALNPNIPTAVGIALNDRIRAGPFGDRIIQTSQSMASNIAQNPGLPDRIRHAAQNVLDMLTR